jgi:hypothetical protein
MTCEVSQETYFMHCLLLLNVALTTDKWKHGQNNVEV